MWHPLILPPCFFTESAWVREIFAKSGSKPHHGVK
jgi:hypothetical protein